MKKIFNGFTLAEVLITLGIIGVVAAMTMPTLIQNHQKQTYVTRLKKAYTVWGQVFQKMQTEDGDFIDNLYDTSFFNYYPPDSSAREAYLNENLNKYIKTLSVKPGTGDIGYSVLYTTGGSKLKFENNYYEILSADGNIYYFTSQLPGLDFKTMVFVDVNGKKGPNQFGRDLFQIYEIDQDGNFIREMNNGLDDCNTTAGWGQYCFNRIVKDGWKMNY